MCLQFAFHSIVSGGKAEDVRNIPWYDPSISAHHSLETKGKYATGFSYKYLHFLSKAEKTTYSEIETMFRRDGSVTLCTEMKPFYWLIEPVTSTLTNRTAQQLHFGTERNRTVPSERGLYNEKECLCNH